MTTTTQAAPRAPLAPETGSGNSPQAFGPSQWLARWQPSPQDPWNLEKAAHLLRRAAFSGRPEELEAMVTLGMDRCVDLLLSVPSAPIPDHGAAVLPNGEYLDLSLKEHQQGMWLFQMATSPWQLQEKLALFWHDHFATGIHKVLVAENMGRQINLFRTLGLGRFRDLLVGVSRDPAMLVWLDNWRNTAAIPQENYGREILELFSMGVDGGYTEADVRAAARCFTGWTLESEWSNRYVFRATDHDDNPKQFLGITIHNPPPFGERDGLDAIDRILQMPQTARYLVKKLLEYFVHEAPSPAVVDLLAERFRQGGYHVRDLMSTILRSNLFYSGLALRTLVKSPIEHVIGAMRNLGITNVRYGGNSRFSPRNPPNGLGVRLLRTGFELLNYDDPSGAREGVAWLNSLTLIERGNAVLELIRVSGSAVAAVMDPMREISRKSLATANQVVDHYLDILVDGQVPAAVRQSLQSFMVTRNNGLPYVFSVTDPAAVDVKVRGVIHLIMLLPEYLMN
jgi:uncharacterized protein (DUF1800 family)